MFIFSGAIEIGFTGKLVLEFAMGGMIKRPWDNDYIAFGNIFLSAGYSFGAVPLPSFRKFFTCYKTLEFVHLIHFNALE